MPKNASKENVKKNVQLMDVKPGKKPTDDVAIVGKRGKPTDDVEIVTRPARPAGPSDDVESILEFKVVLHYHDLPVCTQTKHSRRSGCGSRGPLIRCLEKRGRDRRGEFLYAQCFHLELA